ncbi:hypothetical protein N0O92_13250 [Alkalihalobacillus sp. MEB130]|uniref:hypothetical protein n=1 Tax=Alkalihalobacillus sp. MEB130 TaxID=2976704 RepID=UPI0028E0215B|nr:hypothetical protein [Alkalihalobacillus sp. MEB130]MDT8861202.1 hypothetical protein [Alkalihalobacillus sp. MEB130]
MPRKSATTKTESVEEETEDHSPKEENEDQSNEVNNLTHWLAAVLNYLSDDEVEEIDIEYLLNNTEGLREWWDQYRESNRKLIEEEIISSLGELTLEELESIREKVKK